MLGWGSRWRLPWYGLPHTSELGCHCSVCLCLARWLCDAPAPSCPTEPTRLLSQNSCWLRNCCWGLALCDGHCQESLGSTEESNEAALSREDLTRGRQSCMRSGLSQGFGVELIPSLCHQTDPRPAGRGSGPCFHNRTLFWNSWPARRKPAREFTMSIPTVSWPLGLHATPEQFPLKGALRAQILCSLSTLQVTEGSRWPGSMLSGNLGSTRAQDSGGGGGRCREGSQASPHGQS